MLPIAGQTAKPNGLNFFCGTHGWRGEGCYRLKKIQLVTHTYTYIVFTLAVMSSYTRSALTAYNVFKFFSRYLNKELSQLEQSKV